VHKTQNNFLVGGGMGRWCEIFLLVSAQPLFRLLYCLFVFDFYLAINSDIKPSANVK